MDLQCSGVHTICTIYTCSVDDACTTLCGCNIYWSAHARAARPRAPARGRAGAGGRARAGAGARPPPRATRASLAGLTWLDMLEIACARDVARGILLC
jgi:hypothetical protein